MGEAARTPRVSAAVKWRDHQIINLLDKLQRERDLNPDESSLMERTVRRITRVAKSGAGRQRKIWRSKPSSSAARRMAGQSRFSRMTKCACSQREWAEPTWPCIAGSSDCARA
jgi:hypothetical protein